MSSAKSRTTSFQALETVSAGMASLEAPPSGVPLAMSSLKEKETAQEKDCQEQSSKQEEAAKAKQSHEDEDQQIERALAQLWSEDFHSNWDKAKQFIKRFRSDRPIPFLIQQLFERAIKQPTLDILDRKANDFWFGIFFSRRRRTSQASQTQDRQGGGRTRQ